jgi:hypothetical protein
MAVSESVGVIEIEASSFQKASKITAQISNNYSTQERPPAINWKWLLRRSKEIRCDMAVSESVSVIVVQAAYFQK